MQSSSALFRSREDKVFDCVNTAVLLLLALIVAYPIYFIVIASVSSPLSVSMGKISLWPDMINLEGYKKILKYEDIWRGYRNSIIYTSFGSVLAVTVTVCCGFAFTRPKLPFRRFILIMFTVPMFFNGGIIPTYLTINSLGLVNNPILMILFGSVGMYNIIIARSFIQNSIPAEIYEAAHLDGCGDFRYLTRIIFPMSKALIAVQFIFAIAGHWNDYFNALIYISDEKWKPLPLVIRRILIDTEWSMAESMNIGTVGSDASQAALLALSVKYCVFIVASLPVMLVYPFVQKYFVQGMMLGSVKG